MADTPIQRLKQLDQERAQLLATAKKEALDKASEALSDLTALGFNYRLVEGGGSSTPRATRRVRQVKDGPCPVCKFQTSPPHDARKHRGQGKRKRPFSGAELTAFGLQKV